MKYRTLYDLLRHDYSARVSLGKRWLVVEKGTGEFVIFEQAYRSKIVTIVERTSDESRAVAVLANEDDE